jgi:hypothetical protein
VLPWVRFFGLKKRRKDGLGNGKLFTTLFFLVVEGLLPDRERETGCVSIYILKRENDWGVKRKKKSTGIKTSASAAPGDVNPPIATTIFFIYFLLL